jgi:hypothetical protein
MIHEYKNTCTGSSKHILAPCTLHALDSSIGSDGSSQRTPCQPSKHAQLARSPCRVHVPCSQTGWQVGCSQAATSHPTLSGARAPAVARAVGRGERRLALRAAPAIEALALARRHARAVARAPALALRLGAVVTAPSVRARALARRRAVATSTRTRDFDVLRLNLRTRFRNRQISAVLPPSTKHVAVPPSRTKVLRSILHTL